MKRHLLRRPPDGPGVVAFPVDLFRLRPEPRPGYLDDGLGRAGQDDPCPLDELCALARGHGGGCDPRPEPERCRSLVAALDRLAREGRGDDDEALAEAAEREAADALRRARS